jgi:hypothetical protein
VDKSLLSDEARREVVRRLARVVKLFEEELDDSPSLGELLEILSASVPTNSEFSIELPLVLPLKAKVGGNRPYRGSRKSRTPDLNDAVFVEAADFLSYLSRGLAEINDGTVVAPDELAAGILQALNDSELALKDVAMNEVVSLQSESPRKVTRARRGDVVAIPDKKGNYHLAVVVARNRFGMALGVLRGISRYPRVESPDRYRAASSAIYTDEHLVTDGTWPIIDHVEDLLSLFPDEPEIYHPPDLLSGPEVGEFGAAETSSGRLRNITKQEAEDVGLLNDAYRQVYLSEHLQELVEKYS